jgi:ribonuclease HI
MQENLFHTGSAAAETYTIYSDGACSGNPGPGGYGVIIRSSNGTETELSAGYKHTTNNRMELRGVIAGLTYITKPSIITVVTDSQYIVNAVEKRWLEDWQKKGWRKSDKKPVLNRDLWEIIAQQLKKHKVTFQWIRGHNGHPENERCDALAVAASMGHDLIEDTFEV